MEIMTLLISLFNTGLIILLALIAGVIYFKKNYVIIDLETYNSALEALEEYSQLQQEQEEEIVSDGGIGFFREQIEDEVQDED